MKVRSWVNSKQSPELEGQGLIPWGCVVASSVSGIWSLEGQGDGGLEAHGVCGVLLPEFPDPPSLLPWATH